MKEWNINPEELLAFGDSNNDLEMLDLEGYSYVMSNGTTQAREIAKYIAPSNDDNGVISIIKKLFEF